MLLTLFLALAVAAPVTVVVPADSSSGSVQQSNAALPSSQSPVGSTGSSSTPSSGSPSYVVVSPQAGTGAAPSTGTGAGFSSPSTTTASPDPSSNLPSSGSGSSGSGDGSGTSSGMPSSGSSSPSSGSGSGAGAGAGATGNFQNDILSAHNSYRSKHSVGALTWDDSLAQAAQAAANKGQFAHTQNNQYGENIYETSGSSTTGDAVAQAWYDEISQYSGGWSESTGHYTQMVWKATSKLGCATGNSGSGTLVFCEYSAAGNVMGQFAQNVLPASA